MIPSQLSRALLGIALLTGLSMNAQAADSSKPDFSKGKTIGELQVLTLRDKEFALPTSLLKGIEASQAKQLLGGSETAATPANAYLIRLQGKLILVDTGTGPEGKLMEGLKAANVDPAQIDLILITHFHFDHVGGLVKADGTRAFPKAIVRASQVESDYWLGDEAKIPAQAKTYLSGVKAALAPYQAAGTFKPFAPGENLGKGIQVLPSYGHTPGHTAYAFGPKGKQLWCIGDLIHFGAIQFERPNVAVAFDSDSEKAVPVRKEFFERAAKSHAILAGAHLPQLVQVQKKGEGFKAEPIP